MLDRPACDYAQAVGCNEVRTPYEGSAICLHVGTGGVTAGCVPVSAAAMIAPLRWQGRTARI